MTTEEPDNKGASSPATRPWTVKLKPDERTVVRFWRLRGRLAVEERHNQETSIFRRKLVRLDDVGHSRHNIEVSKRNSYEMATFQPGLFPSNMPFSAHP